MYDIIDAYYDWIEDDMTKQCSKCGEEKPSSEFYRAKANVSGLSSWCKQCNLEQQRKWRSENREHVARQQREYYAKRPKSRKKPWREKNPSKKRAEDAVFYAISLGSLPKANTLRCCMALDGCAGEARDYHHASYEDDDHLAVVPVCRPCHRFIHCHDLELDAPVVVSSVGLIRIAISGL